MSEYNDDNRLAIWKNDKKETDKHPDFKGNGMVNGVEVWVSAWLRAEGDNPKSPSLRISVTPKEEAHSSGVSDAKAAASQAQAPMTANDIDDIPFARKHGLDGG